MKIKEVKLKNFKFHQDLQFEIGKQNCLIYGENGTGKSSIYEALHSIFTVYFRDKNYSFTKFQYNSSIEALNTKVILDDETELVIPHYNYNLPTAITLENKKTIYFANQDLLESIISNDNFYDTVKKSFKNTFASLHNFHKNFEYINSRIDSLNYVEEGKKRQDNIEKMKIFLNQVELRANDIIHNHFEEQFSIGFDYTWGLSNTEDDYKYPNPKIILKIDDEKNLKLNFNEAKLKLSSIAIFFALIKLEENRTNPLKLLVLDDFLTSLDMANRKLIVQYILDNFGEYQKIILTHNVQFYNLIIRLLNMKSEKESWDIKKLFLSKISEDSVSEIRTEKSFLAQAKERLEKGDLQSSGNFLRKEFERIVHEFEMLLELGKVEDMSNILDILKEPRMYYAKPNETFTSFISTLEIFLALPIKDDAKLNKIKDEIKKIKDCKIDLNRAETLADGTTQQHSLLLSLQKTNFYNGVILNSLSHDDIEIEAYRKECINIIELLTNLNKGLSHLKGKKYKYL